MSLIMMLLPVVLKRKGKCMNEANQTRHQQIHGHGNGISEMNKIRFSYALRVFVKILFFIFIPIHTS